MFRKLLSPSLFLVTVAFTGSVLAQDGPPQEPRPDEPRNILRQLGLTPEQIQQLRAANAEHRPLMEAAQRRLREANRDLDMAIYSDTVSDEVFHARLREFQAAQSEVTRLRFQNELAIRRVLTADQLMRFREMRRRFAETRDRMQQRRRPIQDRGQPPDGEQPQRPNPQMRPAVRQAKPII